MQLNRFAKFNLSLQNDAQLLNHSKFSSSFLFFCCCTEQKLKCFVTAICFLYVAIHSQWIHSSTSNKVLNEGSICCLHLAQCQLNTVTAANREIRRNEIAIKWMNLIVNNRSVRSAGLAWMPKCSTFCWLCSVAHSQKAFTEIPINKNEDVLNFIEWMRERAVVLVNNVTENQWTVWNYEDFTTFNPIFVLH